nr:MAG TPA: hypothetical protein [Caudoviricetes sp.]
MCRFVNAQMCFSRFISEPFCIKEVKSWKFRS